MISSPPSAKKLRNLGSKLRRKIKLKDEKLNIFPNSNNITVWSLNDVQNLASQLNLIDCGYIEAKKAWICSCSIRLCRFIIYYTTGRLGITFNHDYISKRFEIITDTIDFETLKSYLSCSNDFVEHIIKYKSKRSSNSNLLFKTPENKIQKRNSSISPQTPQTPQTPSSSSSFGIDLQYEKQFTKELDKYKASDKEKRECALFKSKLCLFEKKFVSNWENKKSVAETFVFHAAYSYIFENVFQTSNADDNENIDTDDTDTNHDNLNFKGEISHTTSNTSSNDINSSNENVNVNNDNDLDAKPKRLSVKDLIKKWEGEKKDKNEDADGNDNNDDDDDTHWEEEAIIHQLQGLTSPKVYT